MKLNSLIKLSLILLFFLVFSITAKAVDTQVLYTKSNLSIKDNSKITLKIYNIYSELKKPEEFTNLVFIIFIVVIILEFKLE